VATYPIHEVNYGTGTVLRGGTYNTDTHQINPAGGTYPAQWDGNVPSGATIFVVYTLPNGDNDYDKLQLSTAVTDGSTTTVTGTPVQLSVCN